MNFNTINTMIIDDDKSPNKINASFKSCKKPDRVQKVFPATKIAKRGFKVSEYGDSYKLRASSKLTAKLQNVDGKLFVKKVLSECYEEECELMKETENPMWDIEQVSLNSFVIKRNK